MEGNGVEKVRRSRRDIVAAFRHTISQCRNLPLHPLIKMNHTHSIKKVFVSSPSKVPKESSVCSKSFSNFSVALPLQIVKHTIFEMRIPIAAMTIICTIASD